MSRASSIRPILVEPKAWPGWCKERTAPVPSATTIDFGLPGVRWLAAET